jgi:hypothetical protein
MVFRLCRSNTCASHLIRIAETTDLQRNALLAAGMDARHLFEDHASGAKGDRPGAGGRWCALALCSPVWKLDRLGRSLSHLLFLPADLFDHASPLDLERCRRRLAVEALDPGEAG